MSKKKYFLISLVMIIALFACNDKEKSHEVLELSDGWKFNAGDNLDYAKPNFDDTYWKNIDVNKRWEDQGYKKLDGFAWYRIKVIIPSSLKNNSELKDSLIFNFGKINDFDQFFFNGELIGENAHNVKQGTKVTDSYKNLGNSMWYAYRRYSLPPDDNLIKWDGENVIAIRVFDLGASGGLYSGDVNITMPQLSDYLAININKNDFSDDGKQFGKTISISNSSAKYILDGELEIEVENNITEDELYEKEISFSLAPGEKKDFSFKFDKPKESTTIEYDFELGDNAETEVSEGVPYILTPPVKDEPQINGALIYGERPDKPFLYRIAATGKRPISFAADNLPKGLTLDAETGIIKGKVKNAGKYDVTLTAKNNLGTDTKTLEIVIGDKLALTPPMGWNSWNCWGLSVSQEKVYDAAKSFVEKGLADHGWTYINIDDGWEIPGKSDAPKRSRKGKILTNEKFPDMKKLGKDIHALGLKFGIYSSPGPLTCGGYTASYKHEYQDARTFAKWGIDYLKYDLCSYRNFMSDQNSVEELKPPYILMNKALRSIDRDIVYSICEYGNGKVWEWGESVGGNLWRTTGDIWDDWNRLYEIGFGQVENAKYAGPGHWNDPDMLVVGWVGWGPNLHQSALTADEQYTHVSLWSLLSAPLLLGNDLTKLDDFTLNLITNDEVIAVDQDKLGKQATPVIKTDNIQVWKKELSDGNIAVGIFNVGDETLDYKLDMKKLGVNEKVTLRDVWRQKDMGKLQNEFTARIPSHGVKLLKVFLK
ncbi:alpha-galactosidase [hydrothermal vent metagenome]|uniref:Alpha-galactosidase n=2 Tax=hydrothermal vent metagenome TaxID=652676 RepID=A0A3B1CGY6_9ZZZZ